jgi:hypothetical protein
VIDSGDTNYLSTVQLRLTPSLVLPTLVVIVSW